MGWIYALRLTSHVVERKLRVRFLGKIQIWISESKNGLLIHEIHTQGGFFGSNPDPDFGDSQSERFLGKGVHV